ncbi:glycosyltransferase [Nitratireductor luteus]|uniref:glycosyltransferase n=1 Tax=Nitratireductor luteus TaxID=2976980 RepID=UPI00223FB9E7|nr:glycosyltransferase [Nitratireductor luteus]
MNMHIITNYEANAGAETMLSRLLRVSAEGTLVASLFEVSERNRLLAGEGARCEALRIGSIGRAVTGLGDLAHLIVREQPRVIVCWMYHAMIAGVLAQKLSRRPVPVFWNVRQSLDDPDVLSRSTRAALAAARYLSHLPAGIIYNSSRALEQHRQYGFANRNVSVIPNGFDAVAQLPPVGRSPKIVGIAARLHPQKDHETFFRAAAIISQKRPDVRFMAVGAGLHESNAAIRKMMAASGLPASSIVLMGETDDMDSFYRAIDLLVLSSRTEGFPNVVAEAMSYGKPVVTTDVGDAAMVVGETGEVVPPGNPKALAEGMDNMLGLSREAYAARSEAARHRVGKYFSLAAVSHRYDTFLGLAA